MINRLNIVKAVLMIFLIVFLVKLSTGDNAKDLDSKQLATVFQKDTAIQDLEVGNDRTLMKLYGIDSEEIPAYVLYYSQSTMGVAELLVVKAEDGQMESIQSQVQTRLDSQKEAFDGYGASQTELLNGSEIVTYGNYLFFGVSEQVENWKEEFLNGVKAS